MCVPNKIRQFPKATAIPDRKVIIVKCGNYESDSISEHLEKHGPYPIKLPETQILSLSSVDIPIDAKPPFKEGANKIKKQGQDQQINFGKVSKKDKEILEEGPLVICNKKNCGCQEFVDDVVAQDMIMTNFAEFLERSKSSDIGIFLILTYIVVKSVNRFWNFYAYEVPSLDDTGNKTGSFSLCQKNFCSLFNFSLMKL